MGTVQAIASAVANFFSVVGQSLGLVKSAQDRKSGADDLAAKQNADVAQRVTQGEQDAANIRDLDDADRHFGVQHDGDR